MATMALAARKQVILTACCLSFLLPPDLLPAQTRQRADAYRSCTFVERIDPDADRHDAAAALFDEIYDRGNGPRTIFLYANALYTCPCDGRLLGSGIGGSRIASGAGGSRISSGTGGSRIGSGTGGSQIGSGTGGSRIASGTGGSRIASGAGGSRVASGAGGSRIGGGSAGLQCRAVRGELTLRTPIDAPVQAYEGASLFEVRRQSITHNRQGAKR